MRGVLVVVLLAAGCSTRGIAALHERPAFSGSVKVTVRAASGPREVAGDLAFDRASAHWQLTLRRGEHADSLLELPAGEVRSFHDGVPSTPSAADRDALALVLELVRAVPAGTEVERLAAGYRLQLAGRQVEVELAEWSTAHGGR